MFHVVAACVAACIVAFATCFASSARSIMSIAWLSPNEGRGPYTFGALSGAAGRRLRFPSLIRGVSNRSEPFAPGPEFVACDRDYGCARRTSNYRTADFERDQACAVQHGRPVHCQTHALAWLKGALGREVNLLAADFGGLAYTKGQGPAALHAPVADVLFDGESAFLPPLVAQG